MAMDVIEINPYDNIIRYYTYYFSTISPAGDYAALRKKYDDLKKIAGQYKDQNDQLRKGLEEWKSEKKGYEYYMTS
jgi:hypothetical protein